MEGYWGSGVMEGSKGGVEGHCVVWSSGGNRGQPGATWNRKGDSMGLG